MARSHPRPSSPDPQDGETDHQQRGKRVKTAHYPSPTPLDDPTPHFANCLLDAENVQKLRKDYLSSEPWKYVVVEKLFQEELLKAVKEECLSELSFTPKETDIYKVNQTGDLASLSYLTEQQIALLPNLLCLRDALYSKTFRNFLHGVTGCGPLSGIKQDMSVNTYSRGCHLLNHDDVIGTRRVSYILYMPLPYYQPWQKDWGGALELYAPQEGPDGPEPENVPTKSIPPSWNQFIFFEVQPGKSFHSVEEVVVGGDAEDGRERLSISGWFHAAQEGEEGYEPEPPQRDVKSSREQLTSTQTIFKSYPDASSPPLPSSMLSELDVSFLSEFLNPVYLQPRTMRALAARFVDESSLELHSFLCDALATKLGIYLPALDARDGLGASREGGIPPHAAGTAEGSNWLIRGPPHKWRYCTLRPSPEGAPAAAVLPRAAMSSVDQIMRSLQDELFPSRAFRAWLAAVSSLLPLRYAAEARRFRPGLDYTLATSEENEARLDVVLGLTPKVEQVEQQRSNGNADDHRNGNGAIDHRRRPLWGWETGEWGGWECYMAPHNEEDDPAVYRLSSHKKERAAAKAKHAETPTEKIDETSVVRDEPVSSPSAAAADPTPLSSSMMTPFASLLGPPPPGRPLSRSLSRHTSPENPPAEGSSPHISVADEEEDDEEEDDGTLLTAQPGFNKLLLVLRDERVMRFVKYVSAAAEGSRWDICGEYEVGMVEEDA